MNKSPIADLLTNAGDRPYRGLVEQHLRRLSTEQLRLAAAGESLKLPEPLQGESMAYVDAVNNRVAHDREFWAHATCKDAYDLFIAIANEHFSVLAELRAEAPSLELEDDLAFALFQIPTVSFAYSASTQRAQRKFMGVRKGIFG